MDTAQVNQMRNEKVVVKVIDKTIVNWCREQHSSINYCRFYFDLPVFALDGIESFRNMSEQEITDISSLNHLLNQANIFFLKSLDTFNGKHILVLLVTV